MTRRNAGFWTEARYRTFIRSALRASFRKWPPKFRVLKEAQTHRKINPASGREAMHYACAKCHFDFPMTGVQVDHIKPIVSTTKGFKSWDDFIDKLFCESPNLQVLCKACHAVKTKKERNKRGKKSV